MPFFISEPLFPRRIVEDHNVAAYVEMVIVINPLGTHDVSMDVRGKRGHLLVPHMRSLWGETRHGPVDYSVSDQHIEHRRPK